MNAQKHWKPREDGVRFGLSHLALLAADLRALADAIDAGAVVVDEIKTADVASQTDFPMTRISLVYSHFRDTKPNEGSDVR